MLKGAVRSVILDSSHSDRGGSAISDFTSPLNAWVGRVRGPTYTLSEQLLEVVGYSLPGLERIEIRLEDSVLRQNDADGRVHGLRPRAVMLSQGSHAEHELSRLNSLAATVRKYASFYPRLTEAKVRDVQLEKALRQVEQKAGEEEKESGRIGFEQRRMLTMPSIGLDRHKRAITAQLEDLDHANQAMKQVIQGMKERPVAK